MPAQELFGQSTTAPPSLLPMPLPSNPNTTTADAASAFDAFLAPAALPAPAAPTVSGGPGAVHITPEEIAALAANPFLPFFAAIQPMTHASALSTTSLPAAASHASGGPTQVAPLSTHQQTAMFFAYVQAIQAATAARAEQSGLPAPLSNPFFSAAPLVPFEAPFPPPAPQAQQHGYAQRSSVQGYHAKPPAKADAEPKNVYDILFEFKENPGVRWVIPKNSIIETRDTQAPFHISVAFHLPYKHQGIVIHLRNANDGILAAMQDVLHESKVSMRFMVKKMQGFASNKTKDKDGRSIVQVVKHAGPVHQHHLENAELLQRPKSVSLPPPEDSGLGTAGFAASFLSETHIDHSDDEHESGIARHPFMDMVGQQPIHDSASVTAAAVAAVLAASSAAGMSGADAAMPPPEPMQRSGMPGDQPDLSSDGPKGDVIKTAATTAIEIAAAAAAVATTSRTTETSRPTLQPVEKTAAFVLQEMPLARLDDATAIPRVQDEAIPDDSLAAYIAAYNAVEGVLDSTTVASSGKDQTTSPASQGVVFEPLTESGEDPSMHNGSHPPKRRKSDSSAEQEETLATGVSAMPVSATADAVQDKPSAKSAKSVKGAKTSESKSGGKTTTTAAKKRTAAVLPDETIDLFSDPINKRRLGAGRPQQRRLQQQASKPHEPLKVALKPGSAKPRDPA
ncbi:hypothetical protein BC831DRAFT_55285 [Entophlyctis helioformis]|nr:hypothetical protein BC831DRAFT_55285 [Entophlyctis helioformis]